MDSYDKTYYEVPFEPDKAKQIKKRIAETKEIREQRSCKKCVYHYTSTYGTCARSNCNFTHDEFKPVKKFA